MWNWLKTKLPTVEQIRHHRSLRIFGKIIHSPYYWHIHTECVARAFAIGLFCAFMPIPFQMVLAASLAIIFRANLFFSVALVWISNPITMPPLFYFCYLIGRWILKVPHRKFNMELSWHWLETTFVNVWKPLLVGSLVCGIASAILGYVIVKLVYKKL